MVSGIVLAQYALTDRMAEAHAMVSLVEQGWADQNEVARAFALRRAHGATASTTLRGGRVGRLGTAPAAIPVGAARLAVCAAAIGPTTQGPRARSSARSPAGSGSARRPSASSCVGWDGKPASPVQSELPLEATPLRTQTCPVLRPRPPRRHCQLAQGADPNLSAFCSAAKRAPSASQDTDPSDRGADRLLARLGLLEDAPPLFGSATAVPRAGVLLALPVLVASGVFECAQENLWQPWPGLLWAAHQLAHAPAHGALAHQTPGGSQGILAPRLGARAGVGPGARSQNAAAQTGPSGRRRTGRPVRPGSGPATGRLARRGPGFPLHRRSCAGLPRPTRAAQGPRGAHAHLAAGHFGLLGQR